MKVWASLHTTSLSLYSATSGSKVSLPLALYAAVSLLQLIRTLDLTQYNIRKGSDTMRGSPSSQSRGNAAIIIEPTEGGSADHEREMCIQLSSMTERVSNV